MTLLPKLPQMTNKVNIRGAGWLPDKAAQDQALKASGQDKIDTYDLVIQVATIVTSGIQGTIYNKPLPTIATGMQAAVDGDALLESRDSDALRKLSDKRNPLFDLFTACTGSASPITQAYLTSRRWKSITGGAVDTLGNLLSLSPATPTQNVPGAVMHGHATALTAMHIARIGYIANQHSAAKQVQDWCKLVETIKTIKLAVRAGQFVGSVVPLASMPTAIAASVIKTGVKLTMIGACFAAAAQLHWIAYNEQEAGSSTEMHPMSASPGGWPASVTPSSRTVSSSRSPSPPPMLQRAISLTKPTRTGPDAGPASAIVWEIFTKRGATRVLGAYDVAALVREPAGWMALGDKLMLI